jgi:hypothetical protein
VVVGTYRETMQFDITETSTYDAIFGLLWLEKHKPDIVYKVRTIQFDKYSYNSEISAIEILLVSLAAIAVYQRKDPNSVLFTLITIPAKELKALKILSEY